jgi:probable rRNA maturation factor
MADEPPDSPVIIQGTRIRLPRSEIAAIGIRLKKQVAKNREFSCLITSAAEIQRLNREFRKKDKTTDVLSFPADDQDFLGDIAISAEAVRDQAKSLGHSVSQEVEILMLHGLLHLLGLDHETDSGEMSKVERRWRAKLQLPLGLIERTVSENAVSEGIVSKNIVPVAKLPTKAKKASR